jgi:NAD(P)-dependent dehydrogenase (short-subunit alcohol dehydrogenase family)
MTKPVALVVGASRGIGRQVAVDMAKNGYRGLSFITALPCRSLNEENRPL